MCQANLPRFRKGRFSFDSRPDPGACNDRLVEAVASEAKSENGSVEHIR